MEAQTATYDPTDCDTCLDRLVCHCLQVTESALVYAIDTFELRTVKDVCRTTGAGEGCTACHRRLRHYLEQRFELPMAQSSSCSPI